jgi:Zn-dependent metalloprotease
MIRSACGCCIAPPDLLARLIEEGTPEQRQAAVQTIAASASMRTQRRLVTRLIRELDQDVHALAVAPPQEVGPEGLLQVVYDMGGSGGSSLPGTEARRTGQPAVGDEAVDSVYASIEKIYDFYKDVYGRVSVDDQNMELISSVHYGAGYDNAFWNGTQMAYGDGSGRIFKKGALANSFTITAHEAQHAVTQFTAGLVYSLQPGALNESYSDVFGALAAQYAAGQTADQAEWLIGEGTLADGLGIALRSLKEPASENVASPQPESMAEYRDLPDDNSPGSDNGGVHINSGIPNRAFCLAATAIGGHAWEKAGKIWYQTLASRLSATAQFVDAANATVAVAEELYGDGAEKEAVASAWQQVGVLS